MNAYALSRHQRDLYHAARHLAIQQSKGGEPDCEGLRVPLMVLEPTLATPEEGVEYAAVTRSWRLLLGPKFWEVSTEERAGLLLHEVLHPLRRHFERGEGKDGTRWNVAADLEINRRLQDAYVTLPPGALVPNCFSPYFRVRPQLAEAYYQQAQNEPNGGRGAGNKCKSQQMIDDTDGDGQPEDGQGQGQDTSQGRMSTDEADAMSEGLAKAIGSEGGNLVREWLAGAPPVRTPQTIARNLRAHSGGNLIVQRFKGRQYPTGLMRPSWRRRGRDMCFILDVSGSLSPDDLKSLIAAIHAMLQDGVASNVDVLCCDTRVTAQFRSVTSTRCFTSVKGGGGTDLIVAMRHKWAQSADEVVLFTDCLFSWPTRNPCPGSVSVVLPGEYDLGSLKFVPRWARIIL